MNFARRRPVTLFPWKRGDIIFSSLILNLMGLAIPLLILQLYDRIIPNQAYYTLTVMGIAVLIVTILESILRHCRSQILVWLGMFFEYATSLGAFKHLMNTKYTEAIKKGNGKQVENLEGVTLLKEFLAGQGFIVLLDLPFVFVYLGVIAFLSPIIAFVPVIVLISFIVSALWVGKKLKKALEKRLDVDDRRYNFIIQIFSNHHTLKSLGMENLILRRYERIHDQCATVEHDINYYSAESRDLSTIFSFLMYCSIICITAFQVINFKTSMGVMAACILLANRAIQPVQAAMVTWTRFQHFEISRERLRDIFSLPQEITEQDSAQIPIKGKITLENLTFAYEDSSVPLFDNLSLTIEAGQIVGLYGPNGAGKTTLSQLILGTITPDGGNILIDDTPLSSYNLSTLHKQIGYLPPKGILFQGTILENMTLFQPLIFSKKAMDLSKELGLDPWIQKLPQAYNTNVGDSLFYVLPDGIQQRICLVRTLMTAPSVLILDESNTSLDDQGELLLKKVLFQLRGQTTVLFITHRPSIETICDVSYELKGGNLHLRKSASIPQLEYAQVAPGASSSPSLSLNTYEKANT